MRNVLWAFAFLFVAGLNACGGGSQSMISTAVTATATASVYSARVQAAPAFAVTSPTPLNVSVIYGGFFPPNSDQSYVQVVISPAPSSTPAVNWTSTNNIFPISATALFPPSSPAPAGATYVGIPNVTLPFAGVVTANIGAPINSAASIPVASYKNTLLGCDLRGAPAVAATTSGDLVNVSSTGGADFYTTTTFGQGTLCSGQPQASPGPTGAPIYNMPYGGVVITGDIASFAYVTTAQWQPAITNWNPTSSNATLLFKTATGGFVKYYFQGTSVFGPYEVSQNGTFINVPSPSPT